MLIFQSLGFFSCKIITTSLTAGRDKLNNINANSDYYSTQKEVVYTIKALI